MSSLHLGSIARKSRASNYVDKEEQSTQELLETLQKSMSRLPTAVQRTIFHTLNDDTEIDVHFAGKPLSLSSTESSIFSTKSSVDFNIERLLGYEPLQEPKSVQFVMADFKSTEFPGYEFVRYYAIMSLANSMNRKLKTFFRTEICEEARQYTWQYNNFHVFGWQREHFLTRRKLKGVAWVQVLTKKIPEECLDLLKQKCDIEELLLLMRPLFVSFLTKKTTDISETTRMVQDAFDFLNIHENIQNELNEGINNMRINVNTLVNASLRRRSSDRQRVRRLLQEQYIESSMINPIKSRYEVSYIEAQIDQTESKKYIRMEPMKQELEKFKFNLTVENVCSESIVQTYYAEIEVYRDRLQNLTKEYEARMEELSNRYIYMRSDIEKLKVQKSFRMTEMTGMRKKVARLKALQETDDTKSIKSQIKGRKKKTKGKSKARFKSPIKKNTKKTQKK